MTGDKLKALRIKKGLKQSELAEKLGLSSSAVGMYEQNRRKPDSEILLKYAEIFDVSVDYILGNDSGESKELMEEIRKFVSSREGLMFNGEILSDDDLEKIMNAIEISTALIKRKNDDKLE